MSWEAFRDETEVCNCGNGTVRYLAESDDWCRIRSWKEYICEHCDAEHRKLLAERESNHALREQLLKRAQTIARDRYLQRWLARFEGLPKANVHALLIGSAGYPSRGTFYKHVRDEALQQYLTRWLSNELERSLDQLGVKDDEIRSLLKERDGIPEYRKPHPYQ